MRDDWLVSKACAVMSIVLSVYSFPPSLFVKEKTKRWKEDERIGTKYCTILHTDSGKAAAFAFRSQRLMKDLSRLK